MNSIATDKTVKSFEDLIVWQKAKDLSLLCYGLFAQSRDFGFRDQVLRASVSVMNNIAEGFELNNDKEFRNYLRIAKGSCGEVRSMMYLAFELKMIDQADYDRITQLCSDVSRLAAGLLKTLDIRLSTFDRSKQ